MASLEGEQSTRVFVSYAWEDDAYRKLVRDLAARLRRDGVEARLDQWHHEPGQSIPEFMSSELRHASKILILTRPAYRANVHAVEDGTQTTGVGYETLLVTSQIWADVSMRRRLVPALLRGEWRDSAPDFLLGVPYVDLRDIPLFEQRYRMLLSKPWAEILAPRVAGRIEYGFEMVGVRGTLSSQCTVTQPRRDQRRTQDVAN